MAVNFVAVGDGFCVTDERSVDPRHSTPAAAQRLSGAWVWGASSSYFAQSQGTVGKLQNCKRLEQTQFVSCNVLTSMDCKNATKSKVRVIKKLMIRRQPTPDGLFEENIC